MLIFLKVLLEINFASTIKNRNFLSAEITTSIALAIKLKESAKEDMFMTFCMIAKSMDL